MDGLKRQLAGLARAAVKDCEAGPRTAAALRSWRERVGRRRVELIAAGKAAASMARAAFDVVAPTRGLVVTKDEHHDGFMPEGLELRFAAHPTPDVRSEAAGRAMEARLRRLSEDAHVVALWSGGASSLLSAPLPGLSLTDVAETNTRLLAAVCTIEEINAVRKRILRATGGRLAAATSAPIDVFVVSDVLGDDVTTIGSGPFARDESAELAKEVVTRLDLPDPVRSRVMTGDDVEASFEHVTHHLVASVQTLLDAATEQAAAAGFTVRRLPPTGDDLEAAVSRLEAAARDLGPGEVIVTGGEPTLVLPDEHGRGGRAQHMAVRMAEVLHGTAELAFLAAGSDGTDGPTPAAGAVVDGRSWSSWGDEASVARDRCDAHPLLARTGEALTWGATGTNVLDLHLLARARK